MKNLLHIFLVSVLLHQSVGYAIGFLVLRGFIKTEIKEIICKLNSKEIKNFEFTKNEFENLSWLDENEFVLNGNLYDVVEIRISPNEKLLNRKSCQEQICEKKIIRCYFDTKETKLISDFQSKNKHKKTENNIKFSLPNSVCNIPQSIVKYTLCSDKTLVYPNINQRFSSNFFCEITTPPPEHSLIHFV